VNQLVVMGGSSLYGSHQVRKCPQCGTYYDFLHEHDSEAGVGYGYTDEAIARITPEEALKYMEQNLLKAIQALEYWTKDYKDWGRTHAKKFKLEYGDEINRLKE